MATPVGDIAVRVGADTSGLTKGLNDASGKLGDFEKSAAATGKAVGALAAAAIAAGAAIATALAVKGFQAVDALDEMAEKAGTSAASLQTLRLALGEAGVDSDQTQAAIKKLNLAIGEAQSGNAKAQSTFDNLGLSVAELAALPADERFAAIADSVSQYGNAADKAVIASELFGAKLGPDMAAAMAQGGDAIRQAKDDIEAMGLAMSDLDAAQVANAMDSFNRAQGVIDGVANKLAVELSPILDAVSQSFIDAGMSGGGFGDMVSAAVQGAIKAVAFLANAVDGVSRIGGVVADSLVYAFAAIQETFTKLALGIIKTLDMIPGVDLTSNVVALEEKVKSAQGVMREAAAEMRAGFEKPLAGDAFLAYVDQAKAASAEAAAATIAAREAAQGGTAETAEESPAVGKAREDAAKLAAIDAEKVRAAAENAALQRETLLAAQATNLADLQKGLMTEQELMAADLEAKRNQVLMANELGVGDKEANQLLIEQLEADHNAKLYDIDKRASDERKRTAEQEAAAKRAILGQSLSGLSSLMNSESRKMFETGKAAAIASAVVNTYLAATKALAELGPIAGPVAAGAMLLQGFNQVANIRKQQFGGGGGGAGGGGSNTTAVNAANTPVSSGGNAGPTTRTNVTLVGDNFGREAVIGLLHEAFKDGFTLST